MIIQGSIEMSSTKHFALTIKDQTTQYHTLFAKKAPGPTKVSLI